MKNVQSTVKGHSDARSNQNNAIISIYEHPPFYKGKKKWDNNDTLSEVYKLGGNNPKNKTLLKSTRLTEVTPSGSHQQDDPRVQSRGRKMWTHLGWLLYGVQECAPRTALDCLEADAPWAFPGACWCDEASPERSRLQLGQELLSSNLALSSADAEREEA